MAAVRVQKTVTFSAVLVTSVETLSYCDSDSDSGGSFILLEDGDEDSDNSSTLGFSPSEEEVEEEEVYYANAWLSSERLIVSFRKTLFV
jgi:hypothetical protein